MLIRHLALSVRDPRRSADFYLSTIGLDGEGRERPWGYQLDLSDGFMVALIQGEPLPTDLADTVHFGCVLAAPEQARDIRERLRAAGVRELEWEDDEDDEGYVGVKIEDPDGYVIELYFEVT